MYEDACMTVVAVDAYGMIEKLVEVGKLGIPVRLIQDGCRGCNDVETICTLCERGFEAEHIGFYKGRYNDHACEVVLVWKEGTEK